MYLQFRLAIAASLFVAAACAAENPAGPQSGATQSWAGWAFLGDAGDFPFRVRLGSEDGEIDLAFAEIYGAPLSEVTRDDKQIAFTWVTETGKRRHFELTVSGSAAEGALTWGDITGSVFMNRSAMPIEGRGVADPGSAEGYYLFPGRAGPADDDVWTVHMAGFGEPVIREVRSGRQRVAFPTSDERYFLGSALYIPAPVESVFAWRHDAENAWIDFGEGRRGNRVEIVRQSRKIESPDGPIRLVVTRRAESPLNIGLVIVPGSNWDTAESAQFQTDNLAALGLTIVTFDKRGHGETPGDAVRAFSDTARDVGHVAGWAQQNLPEIHRWGLLGISRGGWIAPLTPNLNERFDFAVLMVAPAVTPFEQEFQARLRQLEADGASDEDLEFAKQYFESLEQFARSKEGDYVSLHKKAVKRLPEEYLGADPDDAEAWRWWRMNGDYDPHPALTALSVPTLALFGGNDLLVDAERNTQLMREYDNADGVRNIVIKTIPNAGHDLAQRQSGRYYTFTTRGSEGIDEIYRHAIASAD